MNNSSLQIERRPLAKPRPSAARLAAMLDSASLPDMGDRSLDQETHAYLRPRRRKVSSTSTAPVVRRVKFPIPEPRLRVISLAGRDATSNAPSARIVQSLLSAPASSNEAPTQWVSFVYASGASRIAASASSGPIIASPPRPWTSQIVIAPPLTLETDRRPRNVSRSTSVDASTVESKASRTTPAAVTEADGPRFASPEEQVARMAHRSGASIAILAIGVARGIVESAERLAEILEGQYRCRVEIAAAESLAGLRLAAVLGRPRAGDVRLYLYEANSPQRILPALSQLDGVIALVKIGETPVDDAAVWVQALRREQIPLLGVWAA